MNGAPNGLRILAADEDHEALRRTTAVLEQLGHSVSATAIDLAEVTEAVAREDPELSVVVVHRDNGHALDLIEEITAFSEGPVIVLVTDDADGAFVSRAAQRGIFAVAHDETSDALRDAIAVAMSRHAETHRLSEQVDRLETALERRAVIERAKGILMERHGIAERQAFDRLRAHARSTNRTVVHIAGAVADGHVLLGDGAPREA